VGSRQLVVIAGPTGTGKSRLSLSLAARVDGEVVNADSMQLYRGMDIGTAKVPPEERHGVPHHLLDVLDVMERASVATYQRAARAAVEDILSRGRTPILVGGSGLYVQAVVDEIDFPATDPEVRVALERQLGEDGVGAMYQRLRGLDPAAAAIIERGDGRRIVRALEVIELTGRPFTATLPRPGPPRYDAVLLRLDRDTAVLDRDLDERVRDMIAAGFLDEVSALERRGLRRGVTASRALGYQQLLEVLDGRRTLDDAVAATVTATRRFVRRQRSWFRRDRRMLDLDAADPALLDRAVGALRLAGEPAAGTRD
jgi:tRNA dimethylallyltransferase